MTDTVAGEQSVDTVQNFHSIQNDIEESETEPVLEYLGTNDTAEGELQSQTDSSVEEAVQDNSSNENAENKAIVEAMETENTENAAENVEVDSEKDKHSEESEQSEPMDQE